MATVVKPSSLGWRGSASDHLRIGPGFDLGAVDTAATPGFDGGKRSGELLMQELGTRLAELQEKLFAESRTGSDRSVLLVVQGMDTSGKGGIARHVLGMADPQGVEVRAFGVPTAEELRHHYLWRVRRALPAPGRIGVFDRSHYEDVLTVRVHGDLPPETWLRRYQEINRFEAQTAAAGITVVKCALMISPDEQIARLAARLERPDKRWKYSPSDLDSRAAWDDYMHAYQDAFDHTSTLTAPWHVIPADRKWYARLAVTRLLVDTLEGLAPAWPEPAYDIAAERARLAALTPPSEPAPEPARTAKPKTRPKSKPEAKPKTEPKGKPASKGSRKKKG